MFVCLFFYKKSFPLSLCNVIVHEMLRWKGLSVLVCTPKDSHCYASTAKHTALALLLSLALAKLHLPGVQKWRQWQVAHGKGALRKSFKDSGENNQLVSLVPTISNSNVLVAWRSIHVGHMLTVTCMCRKSWVCWALNTIPGSHSQEALPYRHTSLSPLVSPATSRRSCSVC